MENFEAWWSVYKTKTREERVENYSSLTRCQQSILRQSFLEDGWRELFCQNHIDKCLDQIKSKYSIDLLDLRIKALKLNKVFLIKRTIWEKIETMILEYEPLYDSKIIFGGLGVRPWGKKNQFVRVAQRRNK